MTQGFDCATKLNGISAKALKAAGFEFVARYLGSTWKTFDATEAAVIKAAGLKLMSIFEKNSTYPGYFTKAQGVSDAKDADKYAKAIGQPIGTAIYFTVDYDAQASHMSAILSYLDGVRETLKDYKIGLYGSHSVMMAVKGKVDYYWQTYAWSKGQVADHIHMHQYQNSVTVSGVALDRNDIKKDPGDWSLCTPNNAKSPNMYRLIKGEDIYDTSVPVNVYAKLKDGYRVESIPNDKTMSTSMIRLVNSNGDVIDTGDVAKINALIASGYVVAYHS